MIRFPETTTELVTGERLTAAERRYLDSLFFNPNLAKSYLPAVCPDDIERGPLGKCFDTCLFNITWSTKYDYVEGYAKSPDTGDMVYHAWLTDGYHAFDPTWLATKKDQEFAVPSTYTGIALPGAAVMLFNRQTNYAGLFGNRARWPQFVDKLVQSLEEGKLAQ